MTAAAVWAVVGLLVGAAGVTAVGLLVFGLVRRI